MSETFADDRQSEAADAQLLTQPTVDMGTPIELMSSGMRLVSDGGGVVSAGVPPLLCSQFQSNDVKAELRPVDSMPHLMPMTTDAFPIEKTDTDDWVPLVRQHSFKTTASTTSRT